MSATRREFLRAGSIAIVGGTLSAAPLGAAQQTASRTARDLGAVKALVFDTFGTVVDYRSYDHQRRRSARSSQRAHRRLGEVRRRVARRLRARDGPCPQG
jgi:hypothetical protein